MIKWTVGGVSNDEILDRIDAKKLVEDSYQQARQTVRTSSETPEFGWRRRWMKVTRARQNVDKGDRTKKVEWLMSILNTT